MSYHLLMQVLCMSYHRFEVRLSPKCPSAFLVSWRFLRHDFPVSIQLLLLFPPPSSCPVVFTTGFPRIHPPSRPNPSRPPSPRTSSPSSPSITTIRSQTTHKPPTNHRNITKSRKNFQKHLAESQKLTTFALAFENKPLGQEVLSETEAWERHSVTECVT